MPENKNHWLLYDGTCRFCLAMVGRWGKTLVRRGFGLAALHEEWVRERLELPEEELLREMRVLCGSGKVLGGGDALIFLWGSIWWCWPLWLVAHLPGARWLIGRAYRWVAANRSCLSGTCSLHAPSSASRFGRVLVGWLPLAVLPGLVVGFRAVWAKPWIFMWALAFALFFSCKWLTLWRAFTRGAAIGLRGSLAYLLLWPGMDVRPFTDEARPAERAAAGDWLAGLIKTGLGCAILWVGAPLAGATPMLAGWCGLVGLILLLHFGLFHLLALVWRSLGVPVEPIMNAPAAARSLSEFWSERWNRAFNGVVRIFLFRTTYRRIGVTGAMLLVFLASGLVHDLVIALPAGECYGLPTAYFLLQGFGVLIERSGPGRRLGLSRGVAGRLYMAAFTAGPVYWLLFPEPFIRKVINPFLEAIGAL